MGQIYDVAIIGGGINGCGCAADAALRGLSVILFEQDDLASKTSSSSTKLIHGGLRYLEHFEFTLVKKALTERETLLKIAPYLVRPQSFLLPYQKHMRPKWLLKMGLFIYDRLSRHNTLPKSKLIHRQTNHHYFNGLTEQFSHGFLFYDAATEDARLTITNALQANRHGASIRPNSQVTKAEIINDVWHLTIQPKQASSYLIQAKTVINATGPWTNTVAQLTHVPTQRHLTLVKGSHILVPKMYEGEHAYFLQHHDKRVIFVIPYHGFSMIGTTDVAFNESLDKIQISNAEIDYLLTLVNNYFKKHLSCEDIVYSWSGIRPLLTQPGKSSQSLSRDYSFDFAANPAPIITIWGGKVTTYRQLAEEIIDHLRPVFPKMGPSLTKTTPLPGSVFANKDFAYYKEYAQKKYYWLPVDLFNRYLYSYGTNMERLLLSCSNMGAMGKRFGPSLYQSEVDYLLKEEWATSCEDILFRRTKLGLNMNQADIDELQCYLKNTAITPPQVLLSH